MADALTEIDLDALHDAIEAQIAAAFPVFQTVQFYREETDRKSLPKPACLLELVEFETVGAEPDPGTGQIPVYARFEAELVLGFRTTHAKRAIRKLAGSFAAFLHLRRWTGVVTGPGEVVGCYKDDFSPELDQCVVWRVEWAHLVHLGQSVWKPGDEVTPTNVYARPTTPQGAALGAPEKITP